ncbi:MAG TPA: DNA-processing protein DprA [Armatimonadota bacterium]|jgi:DNA processing protein
MDIAAWIWFHRLELPPAKAHRLLSEFGCPEAIRDAEAAQLAASAADLHPDSRARLLAARAQQDVSRELDTLDALGAVPIPFDSPAYPASLKTIADPPILLYCRGELLPDDRLAVAIVGSRRCTWYGRAVAGRLAKDLADRGLTIISGLARGVDTEAHTGALRSGRTIAVLGSGIDVMYPAENRALADEIATNGAVLSEAPLFAQPDAWRFPARNRLISGLSLGIICVEVPIASGALHTATFAMEQGRCVMAAPGDAINGKNAGCHQLLKDGACLVETAEDVLRELGVPVHALPDAPAETLPLPLDLTDDETTLMNALSLQPIQMEELIAACGLTAPAASCALTLLEIKGLVKRLPGNCYARSAYG